MKEGDLVKVKDYEGNTYGYGILADMNPDFNKTGGGAFDVADVWFFRYVASPDLRDQRMLINKKDITVIRNYQDW